MMPTNEHYLLCQRMSLLSVFNLFIESQFQYQAWLTVTFYRLTLKTKLT